MSELFDRIYGALIGASIGDAMGGPVEGFTYEKIMDRYGKVEDLIDYDADIKIAEHGPFALTAGSYTDDSRMSKLFASAIIKKGGIPTDKDIAREFYEAYFGARNELEKSFYEEYYLKAVYREDKACFGGQPTNGAIMGIAPFGALCPCDPEKSFAAAFDALFTAEGYARYSTALAAAGISAAMIPGITVDGVVEKMMETIRNHKKHVEGPYWGEGSMYSFVGRKNEKLIEDCLAVADRHEDIYSMREELRDTVVQQFFADASETLATGVAFFKKANGDFAKTVIGCTNFGRDNDSSASVGGAIAGAFNGASGIPQKWIDLIESNNPGPSFREIAEKFEKIVLENMKKQAEIAANQNKLLER